jgi:hypothetical protein
MTEITVLTQAPSGDLVSEITIEELAKRLGLPEDELGAVLERLGKNLTVGDVHVATSLKDVSVAYLQGDGDDDEDDDPEAVAREADQHGKQTQDDDEDQAQARKSNDNRDDQGRFAEGSGSLDNHAGVQAHVGALHAAGTDRPAFEAAHAALAGDKSMKLSDLKRVAGRYMGGHIHSSGAGRKDVLDQLERTFTQNARFQNKLKADDGGFSLGLNVVKVDADQRKVFGWASVAAVDGVPVVDKQEDIIPIHELEKAAHDFTLYSRTQGDMHTDIGVGRLIESVVIDADKRAAGLVAKDEQGRLVDGWWVGFQVDDDGVWQAHKRGDRLEFSIGGRAQREPVEPVEKAWSDAAREAAAEARAKAAAARELAAQRPNQSGHYNGAAQSFDEAANHFDRSAMQSGSDRTAARKEAEFQMRAGRSSMDMGHRSHATFGRSAG